MEARVLVKAERGSHVLIPEPMDKRPVMGLGPQEFATMHDSMVAGEATLNLQHSLYLDLMDDTLMLLLISLEDIPRTLMGRRLRAMVIESITRIPITEPTLPTSASHQTTTISIGPNRTIFQAGVQSFRHLHIIAIIVTIRGLIPADHGVYRTIQTVVPSVVIRI